MHSNSLPTSDLLLIFYVLGRIFIRSSSVNFNPFNIPGNSLKNKKKKISSFNSLFLFVRVFTDANKASVHSW